ncbi:MAG: helix-turn-helix domain-containing protein [Bifidobacterium tibiigranuli]|jgi:hypothetical protein|uniref:helix-turn-helix domain-containing protein n=1 Tax=Bifidobacterium tibiigranuli TaxID=2172043 RepID=UPI0026F122DE|nr:helix-turn-helix domain-containing protein [Bifidobacterium tibiigranuli]MCI1674262.1 helix-turn-helix domain-containing protein [Bifidobacterium tibiigranuli]MCI1713458.1 helix-turn-helix domain-containing protein [Bifidobacterium tibiigranuli]
MSWQCTSWALREAPCPNASSRLILIALADRCQPDGRSAWPTVDTLMAEAHCSARTVRRSLHDLEETGTIRRGNQELAARDEHGRYLVPQYRPVVWECCMSVALEPVAEKPGAQARLEREGRAASSEGIDEKAESQTCQNDSAGKPRDSADSQTGQNDRSGIGHGSSSAASDRSGTATGGRSYKETNLLTNTPSQSPHGGSARLGDDSAVGNEPTLTLNRMFAALLVEHGLPTPLRSARGHTADLDAARMLLDGRSPGEVLAAASWAMTHPFWRSNVLTLVALRRNWTRIALQRSRPGNPDGRKPGAVGGCEISEADIGHILDRMPCCPEDYPAFKRHIVIGLKAGLPSEQIIAGWVEGHPEYAGSLALPTTAAARTGEVPGHHFAGHGGTARGGAL